MCPQDVCGVGTGCLLWAQTPRPTALYLGLPGPSGWALAWQYRVGHDAAAAAEWGSLMLLLLLLLLGAPHCSGKVPSVSGNWGSGTAAGDRGLQNQSLAA